jgi:hypothetical protein
MRFRLCTVGAATALLVAVPTAAHADYSPSRGNLRVSANDVCVGESVSVSGDGYDAGTVLALRVDDQPASSPRTTEAGTFTTSVPLSGLGAHVVEVQGASAGRGDAVRTLSVTVTVSDCTEVLGGGTGGPGGTGTVVLGTKAGGGASTGGLAGTGWSPTGPALAGIGLVLAGGSLLGVPALRRRRRAL